MKKYIAAVLCLLLVGACFSGCTAKVAIPYYDGIAEDGSYNTSLFYRNDLTVYQAADPGCLYVSPEQDPVWGGYFYMYVTGLGFPVMRSKDLNNWEKIGSSISLEGTWCNNHFWAPEVVYQPANGKYYMYFSASSPIGDDTTEYSSSTEWQDRLYAGIAVSDTPVGPFKLWTGVNADGKVITEKTPPINFREGLGVDEDIGVIDIHPFFDDDGQLYLYFTRHRSSSYSKNAIWGMRMKDMVTPDFSTMTQLTEPGKYTPGGEDYLYEASSVIDEAPNMIKHNGRYYLTYSPFGFADRKYSVSLATSTDPLGVFEKVPAEIGNPVLGIDVYYDQMGGTGHHCFVRAGDEIFSLYHAHMNRATGAGNPRGIAVDRMSFIYNEQLGFDLLHANGPTYSLQPLPSVVSGYENIAADATVSVSNDLGDTAKYLTDGLVTFHDYDGAYEYRSSGKTKITLTFGAPVLITAVMVYNSLYYEYAFSSIDCIEFEVCEAPEGYGGTVPFRGVIENVPVNDAYVRSDEWYMRAGGSALAEFAPMTVTSITITVSQKYTEKDYDGNSIKTIGISDIVILGKRA